MTSPIPITPTSRLDRMTAEDWIIVRLLVLTTQAQLHNPNHTKNKWDPEVIQSVKYLLHKHGGTTLCEAIDAVHKEKES